MILAALKHNESHPKKLGPNEKKGWTQNRHFASPLFLSFSDEPAKLQIISTKRWHTTTMEPVHANRQQSVFVVCNGCDRF